MARQRFIWPAMWSDKSFGKLGPNEKLLFIGLFSLADDDGRIQADPMYLRSHIFTYENWGEQKVRHLRDSVVAAMPSVHLYVVSDEEFIALMKWSDHQKPKYPKASKIPPPFREDSGNDGGTFLSGLGRVGLGGAGMDRDGINPSKAVTEARPPALGEPTERPGENLLRAVSDDSLKGAA